MQDQSQPVVRGVPPPARVLYLLAVAVALLASRSPWTVATLVAAQMVLWPLVGLPLSGLIQQLRKLSFFAVVILVTYALFGERSHPVWRLGPVSVDPSSAMLGVVMVLRVTGVILASQIVRAGAPHAMTAGLRRLGLPQSAAVGLDAVLALLGEEDAGGGGRGGGTGGGGGRGGGRGRGDGGEHGERATGSTVGDSRGGWRAAAGWAKHLRRGDLRPLLRRLDDSVQRARRHVGDHAGAGSDLPVIVGVAVTMLGFKAVKTLPGVPFAPGHKLLILLPLYVVAAVRTNGRWGASAVGLAMGFASFLMGDGKYGIFEVLKHLAPGIVCDLALPLFRGARRGVVFWTIFGAIAGAARFAAEFVVIALAQPPAVAYALLAPGLSSNLFFGFLSGYVTRHVLIALAEIDRTRNATGDTSEVKWNGTTIDGGRTHTHPIEADAGIDGEPRRGGADRE